jgi:hypothetical protein
LLRTVNLIFKRQNLSVLAKNWIDSQYAREELAIKQYNAGSTRKRLSSVR